MQKGNIIVTGGAQGIGKITALALLEHGYQVSVFDTEDEAISEFRDEADTERISFFLTDVSVESNVRDSVSEAYTRYGNISGLVNNAAVQIDKPIAHLSLEEWNKVISVNLTGAFLCVKLALPWLEQAKGSIVNISSTRAFQSEPGTEAYSASKGGIVSLTHALAVSLGPGVRVNCISPGWIDVSAIKKKSKSMQAPLTEADHLQHPAGRIGNADDIARMVLFLLARENSFVTGQNFIIDGGMTRKMIYV